jgi:magnesium-transporting ATPase (P-type)
VNDCTGDNLQTAITVAKDCQMIDRTQKIIQVEAFLVPASIYGAQHLKVVYKDPMAAPEFFSGTVSFRAQTLGSMGKFSWEETRVIDFRSRNCETCTAAISA